MTQCGRSIAALQIIVTGLTAYVTAADELKLPPPQCPPLVRGVLWWLSPEHDKANLNATLDAMDAVGMNVLWLFGTTQLASDANNTLLEEIYTQADRRGWRVIIETSAEGDWYHHWDIPKLKKTDEAQVANVTRRYAKHPSFFGWYINYEIYMEWGEKSDKIRELYAHIGHITREATPGAKLTISPFYLADEWQIRGQFRYATPDEYGQWWQETIRRAGIDIVMLQDSGAEHCECVPPATRIAFLTAMQKACQANGAELWGNVETVEYRARDWDDYARQLKAHREAGTEYPWSFDMQRNAAKLDLASRFSTNIVSWGWEFWNPVRPQDKVGESRRNYAAYKAYYQRVRDQRAVPRSAPASRPGP